MNLQLSNMSFSDYDIASAMTLLNLSHPVKWDIPVNPVKPSDFLVVGLKEAEKQIIIGSNEWEQRLFMELVFLEALRNHNLKMWQEKQIDAGKSPFRGKIDFAFTPYHMIFKTPYIVLSEAKKENFEQGWGQCLIAMKACQILNKKGGYEFDIYGIVSTGMFWEFGKYTTDNKFFKGIGYSLAQPETILGMLDYLFEDCEKKISEFENKAEFNMKPFAKWTIEEVEDTFSLTLQRQSKILEQWLTVSSSPSQESAEQLDRLREKLTDHVWDWNEQELTVKFIAPLLSMINFDQENYQSFMHRDISVSYEEDILGGTVDFVVARGKRSPKKPFFFIHEHKKEKDSSDDPLGQVMIAMVAAQKINNDGNPVYGAYVMGRYWNFVVLKELEYSVSLTYDATKNELEDIFGILQNTKAIIEELIGNIDK